ncbi:GIY-YIG nuclease family protein [Candidatus Dojkabacteria bacterium]|uniref:GIY-YIG nuclease family protein n=1 Tax=Candidatus Dojkabacteria bacterium TaxID=2099670 RepID=A0A955LAP9_9BACT|nr:GIY-YIG nuclease family protein [Candidatus Dojkabacteria bacterium]
MKDFYTYYVYILLCSDSTYYVGVTNNLDRRISEHNLGINKESYTHTRRPVRLVWFGDFNNINNAIAFEKQIKKWSKKKKESLINNDWHTISKLSKKKFN